MNYHLQKLMITNPEELIVKKEEGIKENMRPYIEKLVHSILIKLEKLLRREMTKRVLIKILWEMGIHLVEHYERNIISHLIKLCLDGGYSKKIVENIMKMPLKEIVKKEEVYKLKKMFEVVSEIYNRTNRDIILWYFEVVLRERFGKEIHKREIKYLRETLGSFYRAYKRLREEIGVIAKKVEEILPKSFTINVYRKIFEVKLKGKHYCVGNIVVCSVNEVVKHVLEKFGIKMGQNYVHVVKIPDEWHPIRLSSIDLYMEKRFIKTNVTVQRI